MSTAIFHPFGIGVPHTESSSPLAALRAHPIFGQLPGPVLSGLIAEMRSVQFEEGAWILRRGEPAPAMYLLIEGHALREGAADSQAAQAAVMGPFDLVGQEAAGLRVCQTDVKAQSKVLAWCIPAAALAHVCRQVPELTALFIQSLLQPQAASKAAPDLFRSSAFAAVPGKRVLIGWILTVLLPPVLFALGSMAELSLQARIFISIMGAVITMWIFAVVDDFIPPLLALICVLFVGLAPPGVVLSSFATPSFLMLLSVFALAAMLIESGLSTRALLWLLLRLPDGGMWRQMILLLYGLAMSVGVSQVSRIALMQPAFRDMSQGLRLAAGSPSATALFAATYGGAMLFSTTFATAKSATISVIGLLPPHLQPHVSGLFWIGAAALSTVLLTAIHLASVKWQFPQSGHEVTDRGLLADRLTLLGPMSSSEKVTALGFTIFVLGSVTTSLHQVEPSIVSGGVLILLLVTGALTKVNFQKNIDWPMIVFLISVDCLIRVMEHVGLSAYLSTAFSGASVFVKGDVLNFLALSLVIVLLVRLLLPIPTAMMLTAVILLPIAQAEGIHPWICVFAIAMFADLWFLPYQNGVYLIGVSGGVASHIDEPAFMRHNMVMNIARIACVFASVPLWRWMGLA
jgi:DASS family divalent anion:Na+ symporter